ncbi:hypothetical protein LIS04_194 [Listeria phage LIS04]|nr:hypothetical protein LIS04_194 [Listeria phage LIS04]
MSIKVGEFYCCDYTDAAGIVEVNVIKVTGIKDNNFIFSETMRLVNGEFDVMYSNEWLTNFLEREATNEEISKFYKHRESSSPLRSYTELVTNVLEEA